MHNLNKEIIAIVHSKKSNSEIKILLDKYHHKDIALALSQLSVTQRKRLYRILDNETLAEVFLHLDDVSAYISELSTERAAALFTEMDADEAIEILDEIDENKEEIIKQIDVESKSDIDLLLSYENDEIGSIMSTDFIVLSKNNTIKDAMRKMIEQAGDNDNVETLFVVDENQRYYGLVQLRDLILARNTDNFLDIVKTAYPSLHANDEIKDCYEVLKNYGIPSMVVLDNDGKILGAITTSDVLLMIEEQMNEDYLKFAGLNAHEFDESILVSVKKRVPWLIINLILGIFIAMFVAIFEEVVAILPVIVFFQSLILGMAGNVGTQSLAVTIRGISQDNIAPKQRRRLVFKETKIGFGNGIIFGIISTLSIFLFLIITKPTLAVSINDLGEKIPEAFDFMLATYISLSVGVAIFGAMILSSFFGTTIPIFFQKVKVDPAAASGPFITTVNDIVSIILYYGLAWLLILYFI